VNHRAHVFKKCLAIAAVLLAPFFCGRVFAVDPFAGAVRELAGKILAIVGTQESVGFRFQSLTSLGTKETSAARQALETELRAKGLRIAADPKAAMKVKVTLSENLLQYLWIAEIQRDKSTRW